MILLAVGSLFAACNNKQANEPQQPYTDLKNDCYKGKVMQVTKTEYEGAQIVNGKWTAPKDAVATVRIYDYDTAGFNTLIKEFYLYHDTMYAINTQMVTYQDDTSIIRTVFSPEGKMEQKMKQINLADTGLYIELYDSAGKVTQRQTMVLNKQGRQKKSEFSYYDGHGYNTNNLTFDFVYKQDERLDSLKLTMHDPSGNHIQGRDILMIPNDIQLDSVGNPTLTVIQAHGAAEGSNLLVQRSYIYYK